MDQQNIGKTLLQRILKYKYPLLVVAVGLLLMLWPAGTKKSEQGTEQPEAKVVTLSREQRLEEILAQIQGAGKVRIMLTEARGEHIVYQTDREVSGDRERVDTVIVTDAQRNQAGLIQRIAPAVYLGAVVVCDGADRAEVRLAIVEAVSDLTGLGADKISVLKMK